ncbi:MAG: uracil phosphoribosyltransferase [Candidatus Kapaibacterium sp.]
MSVENLSKVVIEIDHPVAVDELTRMREGTCSPRLFREAMRRLSQLLAVYSSTDLPLATTSVMTPTGVPASGGLLQERIVLIPILRAGLGMVDGFLDILPEAEVGFLGLARDEESLLPTEYYRKFPPQLDEASIFLLDPMLATGGSLGAALQSLSNVDYSQITIVSIISAPEGIASVHSSFPNVKIVTAKIDEALNEEGFIIPGLGDAGDRLWNTE